MTTDYLDSMLRLVQTIDWRLRELDAEEIDLRALLYRYDPTFGRPVERRYALIGTRQSKGESSVQESK